MPTIHSLQSASTLLLDSYGFQVDVFLSNQDSVLLICPEAVASSISVFAAVH
jgi:hypothetical protein